MQEGMSHNSVEECNLNDLRDSSSESCGLERHLLWQSHLEFANSKQLINTSYEDYKRLREMTQYPVKDEISRDILRTFPQHSFFRKECIGSKMLSNILHSFVLSRPEIGYCQVLHILQPK
jgi:hypothetical protein